MGSGKTTTGRRLAKKLRCNFIDLDEMVEEKYHITIPTLFDKYDEDAFRLLEKKTLSETFKKDNIVISTGGGTPCFFNNMEMINANGISIYLKMNSKSLINRLLNAKRRRPLITGKSPEQLLSFVTSQLKLRETFYLKAKIIANGEELDIEWLAKQIADNNDNGSK
jgi:shikimate kinase